MGVDSIRNAVLLLKISHPSLEDYKIGTDGREDLYPGISDLSNKIDGSRCAMALVAAAMWGSYHHPLFLLAAFCVLLSNPYFPCCIRMLVVNNYIFKGLGFE
ncbi:hypothetical protein V6N13_051828 [Hibiscus sabdariffa]|uniref:Uncharacterized protein n=1 Tax=Hibiscus sabdariffa TaxID=183260 RepID=A0ABR2T4M0_9ROSI